MHMAVNKGRQNSAAGKISYVLDVLYGVVGAAASGSGCAIFDSEEHVFLDCCTTAGDQPAGLNIVGFAHKVF